MSRETENCCICSAFADWVCVRTPNAGQLNYLCDRHYHMLRERNPILAARYEVRSQSSTPALQVRMLHLAGE
jgi:hypothetical protein